MGRRNETHEIVDTPAGKRLRIVQTRTDERLLDRAQVEHAIANLGGRIARMEAELADLKAALDDLMAKKPHLPEAAGAAG